MDGLVPGLLVSMPNMTDAFFEKSVILLHDYDREKALGWMINRPSPIKVKDVCDAKVLSKPQQDHPILVGGPVKPESFWAIHSGDFIAQSTVEVNGGVSLSSMEDVLNGLAVGRGPRRFHFAQGYAGWGPGQLDREIREGAWWLAPMNAELVLHTPYPQRWESVISSLGIDPHATSFFATGEA